MWAGGLSAHVAPVCATTCSSPGTRTHWRARRVPPGCHRPESQEACALLQPFDNGTACRVPSVGCQGRPSCPEREVLAPPSRASNSGGRFNKPKSETDTCTPPIQPPLGDFSNSIDPQQTFVMAFSSCVRPHERTLCIGCAHLDLREGRRAINVSTVTLRQRTFGRLGRDLG